MNEKFAAATKAFEDAVAQAKSTAEGYAKTQQEQVEKVSAQLLKGYDELTALTKENVDAVVASGTIVAKGAEEIGKQVVAYTQSSMEKSVSAGKSMLAVKSVKELFDLQTAFAKQSYDAFVAEATKMSELSVKVANEAMAPLSARVNATVEKFAKPLAA